MEEPYTVVSLPSPLDTQYGRSFAAPVFSLSGSRKRKRHEVVVGIDGESVNIYNVQTQNTVGSYPLPPQTYLTVNPCSIFCKSITQPAKAQRQTVLAVGNTPKPQALRLLSFTEDHRSKTPTAQEFSAPIKRECSLRNQAILGVDIVPSQSDGQASDLSTSTIVHYKSGDIDCFRTGSLEKVWQHTAAEVENAMGDVRYAEVIDLDTACKGVLRNREDIVALLKPTSEKLSHATTLLLCQILRIQDEIKLRVSSISAPISSSVQSRHSIIHELFTHTIETGLSPQAVKATYELHAASGTLYQRQGGRVKICDISKITPKVTFDTGRNGKQHVISLTRLNNSSVLLLSRDQLAIYETKYGSVLSSSAVSFGSSSGGKSTTDSKTSGSSGRPPAKCISSFSDLGLVVVLAGNDLMALQLGQAMKDAKQLKVQGPLLIDVIGKKRRAADVNFVEFAVTKGRKRKRLFEWKEEVDQCIAARDLENLEHLIKDDLNTADPSTGEPNGHAAVNGQANGHLSSPGNVWDLGTPSYDPQGTNSAKAMYILSKIFRWTSIDDRGSSDAGHLEGVVGSWNIVKWLALGGYLTSTCVELALAQQGQHSNQQPIVPSGAIMAALAQVEPGLSIVRNALDLPVHWDVFEILQGIRLLMKTIAPHVQHNEDLTNAVNRENGFANGDHDPHADAHDGDVTACSVSSESPFQAQLGTLRPVLSRLQTIPQSALTAAMRSTMNNDEILFFIGILRLMLADAGWTSRYIDAVRNTTAHDLSVHCIAKLLSTAVDAIGAVGWIVGGSSNAEKTENLLSCLRAEVSAALEGCYEANALDTLLQEVKRCEGSLNEAGKRKGKAQSIAESLSTSAALPLGSSMEAPIVADRSLWEGRKKQLSQAEERNKNVGQYTFEQIRV